MVSEDILGDLGTIQELGFGGGDILHSLQYDVKTMGWGQAACTT